MTSRTRYYSFLETDFPFLGSVICSAGWISPAELAAVADAADQT
jgi:hypothetical protein